MKRTYSLSSSTMMGSAMHRCTYLAAIWLAVLLTCLCGTAAQAQTVTVEYIHTDELGSPVAVTNEAGQVIERTLWEPYGAAIGKPNYDGPGYTGHVMDGATGLTYMQQRYYDPSIGRFLSVDPVTAYSNGDSRFFNRYWYAAGNPYRFTDPDGRAFTPETIWDGANVAMGVASFTKNVAIGNYGGAVVDAVGVVIDSAATATPVVPGGAGAAIKAVRGADAAVDAARAGNKVGNVPKPPTGKGSVPPSQRDPKRVVSNTEKREVLNSQGGNCAQCGKPTTMEGSAAHHVQRHADGGPTTKENTAVVCTTCHTDLHRKDKP